MKYPVIALSGIDTDVGKTIATGLLARFCGQSGVDVITQKIVQTGAEGISPDIIKHRQLMGVDINQADLEGITCPYVFKEPCSPHLAAMLEGREIHLNKVEDSTKNLLNDYQLIILEGAGGLMVPLTRDDLFIDYVERKKLPLILVTSTRIGSINHTLMSLEVLRQRGVKLLGIIYNLYPAVGDEVENDSRRVFQESLKREGVTDIVFDMKVYNTINDQSIVKSFSPLVERICGVRNVKS